jgi:hypothetical protein
LLNPVLLLLITWLLQVVVAAVLLLVLPAGPLAAAVAQADIAPLQVLQVVIILRNQAFL